jgi:hypothetical protein
MRSDKKAMKQEDFFRIYLPALERALENDEINSGFYTKNPEDFIEEKYQQEIEEHIENTDEYKFFLNWVIDYFDAKSHYFDSINDIPIYEFRNKIIVWIKKIKILNNSK